MKRLLLTIASILLLGIGLGPSALADTWNKRTTLTVKENIEVGGTVLTPGTYVVKLLDFASNRHIVQIFNRDETKLITMIFAMPNYPVRVAEGTVLTVGETPAGQPKPLRAWFSGGDSFGQEFAALK